MSNWLTVSLMLVGLAVFGGLAFWLRLRWWPSLAIRLVLLALIVLAADAGMGPQDAAGAGKEILLLDVSDSVSVADLQTARIFGMDWLSQRPSREVIVFGAETGFVLSEEWVKVASGGSDLLDALMLAETRLDSSPGRLVLATDGLVADESAVRARLAALAEEHFTVDVIPLTAVNYAVDARMQQVEAPSAVWVGTPFEIGVTVVSTMETTGMLEVLINGQLFGAEEVTLQPGVNQLSFPLSADSSGIMSIEARVAVAGDEFPGNDRYFESVRVFSSPAILFVTKAKGSASGLIESLRASGSEVQVAAPGELPTSMAGLSQYPVVMIHDLLAQDLTSEQMTALRVHVSQMGRSAIFIGGQNSYTLGGYQNSGLAPLLPVTLEAPPRMERVPITFLLVLDRSGSMAGDRDSDIAPIDLTREGAIRAVETLRPEDFFGVLSFSDQNRWEVPIQAVGEGLELRDAQDKIGRIEARGTTNMYQALDTAIQGLLATSTTEYPHILLMSDGVSQDGSGDEFDALVRLARTNGLSISTISLGQESDPNRLAAIAAAGGGRFYQVNNPLDLPGVMISESRAIQAENVQEGLTNFVLGEENHPAVAGIRLDEMPRLRAYNALVSKSDLGAEDVLLSGNFGDPLLSVMQVGLGRTAAWMGDTGESWLIDPDGWEDQGKFWQQVIRYTLPNPTLDQANVQIEVGHRETTVRVRLANEIRDKLEPGSLAFLTRLMDGQLLAAPFIQVDGSNYEAVFQTPDFGSYPAVLQYSLEGEQRQVMAPFVVNYPAEWQFGEVENRAVIINQWQGVAEETTFEGELLRGILEKRANQGFGWYDVLLIVLVLSWPVEIAVRRWRMPWRRP